MANGIPLQGPLSRAPQVACYLALTAIVDTDRRKIYAREDLPLVSSTGSAQCVDQRCNFDLVRKIPAVRTAIFAVVDQPERTFASVDVCDNHGHVVLFPISFFS
jgi:hypothetical protein